MASGVVGARKRSMLRCFFGLCEGLGKSGWVGISLNQVLMTLYTVEGGDLLRLGFWDRKETTLLIIPIRTCINSIRWQRFRAVKYLASPFLEAHERSHGHRSVCYHDSSTPSCNSSARRNPRSPSCGTASENSLKHPLRLPDTCFMPFHFP